MANTSQRNLLLDLVTGTNPMTPSDVEHFAAFGKMIAEYSNAEVMIHLAARKLTGLPDAKARVLFGGMRMGDIRECIYKMMAIDGLEKSKKDTVEDCLTQYDWISKVRHKLVHRQLDYIGEKGLRANNRMTAKTTANAEVLTLDLESLVDMQMDLIKISLRLGVIFYPPDESEQIGPNALVALQEPWRYKSPEAGNGKKQLPSGRQKQQRRPPPSSA